MKTRKARVGGPCIEASEDKLAGTYRMGATQFVERQR